MTVLADGITITLGQNHWSFGLSFYSVSGYCSYCWYSSGVYCRLEASPGGYRGNRLRRCWCLAYD